ncbi:MAG: uracil-DNA glycosylase [Undibacterium sp.]|uniref:uracil-DNA glycosylase n=1 Tax=Undibacterium sp. TaxID=1914977 RepID=UPI00271F1E62|nr:uracil-DNA glycosylase [Undibacterium sp.]MDO8653637.1 uracil-DNA glycosylase [Undibacterium sp.]
MRNRQATVPQFPDVIQKALKSVHISWLPVLIDGLNAMYVADPTYLDSLIDGHFLPENGRMFAAFSIPINQVRYVLIGEGPYPRAASATGVSFMDGAVNELWSNETHGGLSKKVNRATSLRNFIKMLLVADGLLDVNNTTNSAMISVSSFARQADSGLIKSLSELQSNLILHGFLLLNATLVYRLEVAPRRDAKAWQPFLQVIFSALNDHQKTIDGKSVILLLWGKVAELLKQIPAIDYFSSILAEHPYNLSFIANKAMQSFFSPLHLMRKQKKR